MSEQPYVVAPACYQPFAFNNDRSSSSVTPDWETG